MNQYVIITIVYIFRSLKMFKTLCFITVASIVLFELKPILAFEKVSGTPYIPPGFERPFYYRFRNFYDSNLPGLLVLIINFNYC
jgi:hypothetical protein